MNAVAALQAAAARVRPFLRPEVVPLLVALALLPRVLTPIQGTHHKWRQADTAAVARNLAYESPDFFHPRIDLREDKSGITGMEFPLYQAVVAVPLAVTGKDWDGWGKVVSLLAAAGCWFLLVRLLVRRLGLHPWAAHVSCGAVPLFLGYASMYMPETTALFLALLFAERLDAWWETGRTRTLVAATVSLALAALVRPYVVFWGLLLLVALGMAAWRQRARVVPVLAAGVLALVPMGLWYFVWCPHLVRTYGIDYFFTGNPLAENVAVVLSPRFWDRFSSVLRRFYVREGCTPLLLLGLGLVPAALQRARHPWWLWGALAVPVVAVPGVGLLSGLHFEPHVYYFFAIIPCVVLVFALSLDWVVRQVPLAFPLLAAFVVADAVNTVPVQMSTKDAEVALYQDVKPHVAARVLPTDLVVVEDLGSRPWHLYEIRRRGWSVPGKTLRDPAFVQDVRARGARWVVYVEESTQRYALASMDEWAAR